MSLRGVSAQTRPLAETSRFLIVTVGATPFALHADAVRGLLTVEEAGPTVSPGEQGMTYTVLDLAARLGTSPDQNGPETRVILLSNGSARGSIRVAQVHGLKELERSQILPLPVQFQGEERQWYRGVVLLDESVALILNLAWLMSGDRSGKSQQSVEQRGASQRLLETRPGLATGRV